MRSLRSATFLSAVLILGSLSAQAATLFGKVIEVTEGDVIKVLNMNRQVRIRLMGIDAPEKSQMFGDVARQHLVDLIMDRNVVVEYSGLGRDGTIVGRVLLNNADMNAQMIRDGAAWFDPTYKGELGEERCEIYFHSEQAARNEKRGLWQTEGAIAPWDFVKSEESKRETQASRIRSTNNARVDRPRTELASESLINPGSGATAAPGNSGVNSTPPDKGWERFQPPGESFSAIVPSGGKFTREPIPLGNQKIDVNFYMARDGGSIFAIMWTSGPSSGETDTEVIKSTLLGFLRGIGAGHESLGGQFSCEPEAETDVSAAGFTGRNFKLTGCTIPAVARVFTKSAAGKRQLYLGAVFYMRDESNVDRFLESFSISGTVAPAKVSRKVSN